MCLMPTIHYSLFTIHYPLFTNHCRLPTADLGTVQLPAYYVPDADYSLLTIHYSLPTIHYPLPTADIKIDPPNNKMYFYMVKIC